MDAFPAPVVNQIIQNWVGITFHVDFQMTRLRRIIQIHHHLPQISKRYTLHFSFLTLFLQDFTLSYKDSAIEELFLRWDTTKSRWKLIFGSIFIFLFLSVYLWICSCGKESDWDCGDFIFLVISTLLFWIPLIALLLPEPYDWKYRQASHSTPSLK